MIEDQIKISFPERRDLEAMVTIPDKFDYALLLSHGAGAGMEHQFMQTLTKQLANNKIATLRFNFPYITNGRKIPDHPTTAKKAIQIAWQDFSKRFQQTPMFMGGKSFGGRMMSLFLSEELPKNISGIIYFGFPLHAPGKDSMHRASHLDQIKCPMLFLQGTRDRLANVEMMNTVVSELTKSQIIWYQGADHSFKRLKRSGISHVTSITSLAQDTNKWMSNIL